MRWDDLFDDLAGQWEAEARRDLDGEVADRTRAERSGIGLVERLASGGRVDLRLVTGARLEGSIGDAGRDWVVLYPRAGQPVLVPFTAIASVAGLARRADGATARRRFGLGYALRGLSRDRAVVSLTDASGATCSGTIDAVGRDMLDLTEHPADVPRRPEHVTGSRVVPFSALVLVRPG